MSTSGLSPELTEASDAVERTAVEIKVSLLNFASALGTWQDRYEKATGQTERLES